MGLISNSDYVYIARSNGISVYNLETKQINQITMLNSELPANYINAFLKLDENEYLISTKGGLCTIKNGIISVNNPICKDYPDNDSRKIYRDKQNKIWTYSAHKVHCYDNGIWKSVNLEDSVSTDFDIWDISLVGNGVWVMFNDNLKTQTKFYDTPYIDFRINIGIISDFKLANIFNDKSEFPQRQGDYSMFDAGDYIVWKNYDSVYKYENNVWASTLEFNHNGLKPFWFQPFVQDNNGLIWYTVSDENQTKSHPLSYNTKTKEIKAYLENEEETNIGAIYAFENNLIVAKSTNVFYILKDSEWQQIKKEDFGINDNTFLANAFLINNKIYSIAFNGKLPNNSLVCIEDGSHIPPVTLGLPYSKLTQVEIDKLGKGIYRGNTFNSDVLEFSADTGYVNIKPLLNTSIPEIKTLPNGNVYFTGYRTDNTLKSNFISTFDNNNIVNTNVGFESKEDTRITTFDFSDDLIFSLGNYIYAVDSLNTFISVYDTKEKTLKTFDKHNSDMPDYYIERFGLIAFLRDTVTMDIAVDNELSPWILTSKCLIKLKKNGSDKFNISYNGNPNYTSKIRYDKFSNEILFLNSYFLPTYKFNIEKKEFDTIDISNSGIFGKVTKVKKLTDNNIWAADDLGYLYNYTGNGKFKIYDLKISNRPNLKFPILDFTIDFNNNIYLATEIGLLLNNSLVSDVDDKDFIVDNGIIIYPNPASDFITITLPNTNHKLQGVVENEQGNGLEKIQIFNTLGIEVGQTSLIDDKNRIDISHLPAGVYFIKIGDKVKKLVKI
jgi:hypothetical protein